MADSTSGQASRVQPVNIGHGVQFWGKTQDGFEVYTGPREKDGLPQTVCFMQKGSRERVPTLRRGQCPFGLARGLVSGSIRL